MLNKLKWLGIDWDEGPESLHFEQTNKEGPSQAYQVSKRKDYYSKLAQSLIENKDAYHCFCTKEHLQGQDKYDRKCYSMPQSEVNQRLADG